MKSELQITCKVQEIITFQIFVINSNEEKWLQKISWTWFDWKNETIGDWIIRYEIDLGCYRLKVLGLVC